MGGSDDGGWQELRLPSRRQCPKLFYLLSTQNELLTLLLTDLIGIWECSLDRYDILAEASRQHTSIDPSGSSDQFEVLLSKITKSLKDGKNVLVRSNERDRHVLRLKTSIDLPKPLRPLEWTFKLTPQPASELAERILRPSLHEVAVSQEKILSLLRIIREKDHVITRLLDRIGSSAVDLSLIFPGITGVASRKGGHISVTEAKKHVPGMASFDEKSWTRQFANDDGYAGADRTGLTNLVRGCEKCFVHTRSEHEEWINDLPPLDKLNQESEKSRQSSPPARKAAATRPPASGTESTASDDDGDDFERQPTPPGLRSKQPEARKPSKAVSEEDAEDEAALVKGASTSKSKIGALGQRNATKAFGTYKARRTSSSPPARTPPPPARRGSDASTATTTPSPSEGEDSKDSDPHSSKRQRGKPQPSNKPKLGGLKKKRPANTSTSLSPPSVPTVRDSLVQQSVSTRAPSPASANAADRDASASDSDSTSTDFDIDPRDKTEPQQQSEPEAKSKPKPKQEQNPKQKQSQESSASTPKRRLGRIGRKQPDRDTGSVASPTPQSSTKRKDTTAAGRRGDDSDRTGSPSPAPVARFSTSKAKLASHPKSAASPPAEETSEKGPGGKKQGEAEKQETEQEKESRRRMELKRTLDAPTGMKKKRRF